MLFSPLLFPLASWIREFTWENYIRFVFLIFSQTIHALPGISQELWGDTPPAWTKRLVILGEISHSDSWSRSKTWAFLLLLPFFLARRGRTKKEGEREYLVALRWWKPGMEMHDIVRTIGRCLDLSSRCWTTAPVRLLLLPHLRERVSYATVCLNEKERNIFVKWGEEVARCSGTS